MPSEGGIEPGFVDDLLSLPTREEQAELLRNGGLLDPEGLDRLLDAADRLLNSDPGKAQRLTELGSDLAGPAGAPAIVPRAMYIRAGVHDLNGEFDAELRLTRSAHDGYVALGMNAEALRTNVGKMGTLLDLGRYQEALDAGDVVLSALKGHDGLGARPTAQESDLLTALVHQNQGICYEHTGRYGEALKAYAVAEALYRDLGAKERLGEVLDNKGVLLSYLGRGTEALASHGAAADIFDEAGLALSHAMSLSNMGETHLWLANYVESLGAFERSRQALDRIDADAVEYFLLRNTADAYLALNLYSEALTSYRQADDLLRRAGMEHDRARALWGMGSALAATSELERAEEALAEAARLFTAADNLPLLSGVMLEQAFLLAIRGDRADALDTTRRALKLVSGGAYTVQQVYAHLRLADLLLPDTTEPEAHLLAARRLAHRLALPQLRYRSNERLGHLRRLQGRDEEAMALLEAAVEEIERLRGTVAQDTLRVSFLKDKTAAYEDLLLLHLARDDTEAVEGAFAVAERARSRALVDLISGVAGRESPVPEDQGAEDRVRALQADLNATYSELLGGAVDGGRQAPLPDLRSRANELEQEISRLRLQAAANDTAPDPFSGVVSPDDVGGRIPADTALLAYHAIGDELLAFVVAGGGVRVVRNLGSVSWARRLLHKLDVQWQRFRAGQEFAGRHMAMLQRSARQTLGALYDGLVAPLEPLLDDRAAGETSAAAKIAVVPHSPLHRVPFHALFDGRRFLIERFEISYAPSATVYALCQERAPRSRDGALVLGVEDPLIPESLVEASAVAERLPGARVRLGQNATIAALREEASRYGTLHLACHGLFRADNPMFSALNLDDGWLSAADALNLDLPDSLVTLSACESGRSEVVGGDEVLGLTRAFLGAGAATLVVSLWLVQDETTAELMASWYERMSDGEGPAAALRAAQLEIKELYPHPYYWAPFVLIGKR